MAHYRMGFEMTPIGDSSRVRVFIDYSLPAGLVGRWLGCIFGPLYARWCTRRMTRDAVEYFSRTAQTRRRPESSGTGSRSGF
jgi:hypothetical protein